MHGAWQAERERETDLALLPVEGNGLAVDDEGRDSLNCGLVDDSGELGVLGGVVLEVAREHLD